MARTRQRAHSLAGHGRCHARIRHRRARIARRLPLPVHPVRGQGRRDQVDRQFRHPDPDLRHARLGSEHRGRTGGAARPRLRRVLCGRRLFLRHARRPTEFCRAIGPSFWPLWAFWICLPVAGILAAFWGITLGFPVLRLRGDYLAIVTLAFGEIIRLVLINWIDLTNGYAGISGIPQHASSACRSTRHRRAASPPSSGSSSRRSIAPSSSST